jgi:chorismate dehydratase
MASPQPAEEIAHRFAREKRRVLDSREEDLSDSIAPFRVGSVPYLNAVPLTRGLEDQVQFVAPSKLAQMLRQGELDAALVSVTEVLFNDLYDVLDGIAVAALGEVVSVFLAHARPIEEIQEVYCDPASLTSVNLLRVLLAERGLKPAFRSLAELPPGTTPDYFLLIGDGAIEYLRSPHTHQIWDLGAAWYEMAHLPFVYAAWALRRGIDNTKLKCKLREARDFGLETLDYIILSNTRFDYDFRKDYLGWHIHYHLGADEKRGLLHFAELLRKHTGQEIYPPRFVH